MLHYDVWLLVVALPDICFALALYREYRNEGIAWWRCLAWIIAMSAINLYLLWATATSH